MKGVKSDSLPFISQSRVDVENISKSSWTQWVLGSCPAKNIHNFSIPSVCFMNVMLTKLVPNELLREWYSSYFLLYFGFNCCKKKDTSSMSSPCPWEGHGLCVPCWNYEDDSNSPIYLPGIRMFLFPTPWNCPQTKWPQKREVKAKHRKPHLNIFHHRRGWKKTRGEGRGFFTFHTAPPKHKSRLTSFIAVIWDHLWLKRS